MRITEEKFRGLSIEERERFIKTCSIQELMEMDGVVFINVDVNGRTELGRFLSTFPKTPFKHPHYDNFASMEAFWNWLCSGPPGARDDSLRPLSMQPAKSAGRKSSWTKVENFYGEIVFATYVKIKSNSDMVGKMIESKLPFVMFYKGGDKDAPMDLRIPRITPNRRWLLRGIEDIREHLKKHDVFEPYTVNQDLLF